MIALMTAGTLALSLLTAPSPAQAAPPPDGVAIEVVTANGSGCPINTLGAAGVRISPDGSRLSVSYPSFIAHVGIGAVTEFRKNCQLSLRITRPDGYSYAITRTDQHGFAHLAAGATALQRSSIYFQGTTPTQVSSHPFTGPFNDVWETRTTAGLADLVWQPCGSERLLNINLELRVNAGTSANAVSIMAMDSSSVSTHHLAWRTC